MTGMPNPVMVLVGVTGLLIALAPLGLIHLTNDFIKQKSLHRQAF